MEALVGKHDTDDLNNIKFQQTEIDRTDDEINTMKKYLDFDDEADRREAYVPTAGTVAPISSTKLLIAKIAISAVIIAIAFGVVTFFPQLFQFSTNVMINSGILVVGFSALTIPSGVPLDRDTVTRVQRGVAELLAADFGPRVLVDDDTVARIFQRVLSERREPRDRVIERCIMELSNEFKTTELEKQKHLKWERAFWHVGSAYDSSARMSGGDWTVKYSAQPSTLNFYHSVGGSFQ